MKILVPQAENPGVRLSGLFISSQPTVSEFKLLGI